MRNPQIERLKIHINQIQYTDLYGYNLNKQTLKIYTCRYKNEKFELWIFYTKELLSFIFKHHTGIIAMFLKQSLRDSKIFMDKI